MTVTEATTSTPTVGAFSGLPPLLAEATLHLDARRYSGSGSWTNLGTLGSTGTPTTITDSPSAPVFTSGVADYWDIPITNPLLTNENHGFRIADNAALDITTARTFALVFTPDVTNATGVKYLWKYDVGGGPTDLNANSGWVIENVDNIGSGAGSGGLLVAVNDGDATPSGGVFTMISGRQIVVARFDLSADTLTVDRNGSRINNKLTSQSTSDLSGISDGATTAPVRIGGGQNLESFTMWSRALTDAETATLPSLLGV